VLANQIRVGRITLDGAQSIHIEAEQLLDGREFAVDSAEVLRLAAESGRSAYDCEFVVLADYFDVPLYSADRRLVERFPGRARLLAD
jgi:predicted nucleic acid-binding protein